MARRRVRGEGSIYQRSSDERWVGTVDLGIVGGKRVRKTVTAATKRELMPKLDRLRAQIGAGVLPETVTLDQWVTYWLSNIAPRRLSAATVEKYSDRHRLHLAPALGHQRLQDLRPEHVRTMQQQQIAAGMGAGTAQGVHTVLQAALSAAEAESRVSRNVASIVGPPSGKSAKHPILTADQARAVLAGARTPRELARLMMALLTGMRQGEVLALEWDDVHEDAEIPVVMVNKTVSRTRDVVAPKGGKSRAVPLVAPLAEALAGHRMTSGGRGLVFPADDGGYVHPKTDWKRWAYALRRADVPHVPLHGARGSCATILQQAGVPERIIADILGHSSARMTQEHYLHSSTQDRQQALARASSLMVG